MDEQAVNMVNELIAKARVAQKQFESFSQEKTDEAVRAIGKVVYDRAEELAKLACEESGMGVYADKVAKCHGKSKCIWNSLKGKKSVGIIGEDKQTGIIRVAKAKGVVGSVTPVTNPVVTPMCNAMFALKGQNASSAPQSAENQQIRYRPVPRRAEEARTSRGPRADR